MGNKLWFVGWCGFWKVWRLTEPNISKPWVKTNHRLKSNMHSLRAYVNYIWKKWECLGLCITKSQEIYMHLLGGNLQHAESIAHLIPELHIRTSYPLHGLLCTSCQKEFLTYRWKLPKAARPSAGAVRTYNLRLISFKVSLSIYFINHLIPDNTKLPTKTLETLP